ncbi:MAG TPA: Gfo/Idh/MocA family oxidoreductase [archaeon]|nr:Gfo/Idh/MocA family oxidoreductase [Bacteroidales bacterium]HUU27377.1 Gfo/Idh/MocA family oxidoreductase [archaeon]
MTQSYDKPQVVLVGGGMITEIQLLPSLYHIQRLGLIGEISICALNGAPLKKIAGNQSLRKAFPGRRFIPYPDFNKVDPEKPFPDLYREVLREAPACSIAIIAVPDQLHYLMVKEALNCDKHILVVKPLVLKYKEAVELEKLAHDKGLFVGIEYHKRFDDRSLVTRGRFRNGDLGEFRLGYASLIEPWYYRNSNFQNWCTIENSDMFTYIGCHYVDLVAFITGLLPVEVSVHGVVESYPNGNKGYLWTDGRVIWDNGGCLAVLNGMGYPNVAPGGNSQGMTLFCRGENDGALVIHDDQYRGVKHSYTNKGPDEGDTYYNEVSPDYFKLVDLGGETLTPVGYGYRSIEGIVRSVHRVEKAAAGAAGAEALKKRQAEIKAIDREGIIATPANSSYNELVIEAGRMSITNHARPVVIEYGDHPHVRFRE